MGRAASICKQPSGSHYGAFRLFISVCSFPGLVDAELKQKELFLSSGRLVDNYYRVHLQWGLLTIQGAWSLLLGIAPLFLCHASVDSTLLGMNFLLAQSIWGELP